MKPRTILISGASRGIGHAIAARLLAEGQRVIGLARDFSGCDLNPPEFQPEPLDLADLAALPARLQDLSRRHPTVDGLVLNAGRGRFGSLEEFSCTQIGELMALNFTAAACLTRTFLPAMKRRGAGDLIFIGSEAALWGGRRGAVYAASKAALRAFARALREECARSGVRVCVINPGLVRTEFYRQQPFAPGAAPEHALTADDVASAVLLVLNYRAGVVVDEIDLGPLKKVLRFPG